MDFIGYPRTPHIQGSGLQKGDDARGIIPIASLRGLHAVYEEKVDGANSALSFDSAGELLLQSRGHYLSTARDIHRERHFNYFKSWASLHADVMLERLEDRYVVYGEWMGAVHSIFYDHLPHLFLEFDVWDRQNDVFLSTTARRALLEGLPITSVPVLFKGELESSAHIRSLVGPSLFRSDAWRDGLRRSCATVNDDYDVRLSRLVGDGDCEGGYMKFEEGDRVIGRAKWVREGFVQTLLDADVHWQSTFVVPNLLGRPMDGLPPHLVRPGAVVVDYDPDAPHEWVAAIRPIAEARP